MFRLDFEGAQQDGLIFESRSDAGARLGHKLLKERSQATVVLGLTRGGVSVAYEVAGALEAELDIIVVKKIGAPFSKELALGAACADETTFVRNAAAKELGVNGQYLAEQTRRRAAEAAAAERYFREDVPPIDLRGKSVAIVDDGVATGATLGAALVCARKHGAAHVTVAVPVASQEAAQRLSAEADRFFALETPSDFWAVGQFYRDFAQVGDETVKLLLRQARGLRTAAAVPLQGGKRAADP